MTNYKKYSDYVVLIIIISTVIRSLIAGFIELGNDEVYYRLYALYPDWSHFDHPLMIGILMQITTLDMFFQHEFFLRLGSIIIGAINIWHIFKIGLVLKDARVGYYSALLYVASIYASLITGVFILPDTPQSLFWLWALLLILQTVPKCPNQPMSGLNMLRVSAVIGLGILSKYTTIFLWFGIGMYIILFNREWLKSKWLYMGIFISVVISLPILIWNIQNDFISINFHSERVEVSGYSLNPDYFFSEFFGELLYNNPVVYILIIISVIAGLRQRLGIEKSHFRMILAAGLPIVITFLIFSLFRRTLPHWTAPGITGMIPLAGYYLANKYNSRKKLPASIIAALSITIIVILAGMVQIKSGIFPVDNTKEFNRVGKNDPSLDMFGYKKSGDLFRIIVARDLKEGTMDQNTVLIGSKWFPLANFEYYAARKAGIETLGLGKLSDIHKYAWINEDRGGFIMGMDAYYLTDSREFREPSEILYEHFTEIIPGDTIEIYRGNKIAKRVFLYRLKDLKKIPDPIIK